jgi:hypothetical protein
VLRGLLDLLLVDVWPEALDHIGGLPDHLHHVLSLVCFAWRVIGCFLCIYPDARAFQARGLLVGPGGYRLCAGVLRLAHRFGGGPYAWAMMASFGPPVASLVRPVGCATPFRRARDGSLAVVRGRHAQSDAH